MEPAELAAPLRGICMALPEVTERPSHGAPTWFVRGIDWTETAELCHDAYRAVAPAKLAALISSQPMPRR